MPPTITTRCPFATCISVSVSKFDPPHAVSRYEGNPSLLLQIISKAKDFEALQTLGAAAADAAPSPRTSLDSQQAEAASAVAASAVCATSSSSANQLGDAAHDIPPFEATDEWLCALRDRLPLEPTARVLHHLQVRTTLISPVA